MLNPPKTKKSSFSKNLREDTSEVLAKIFEKSLVISKADFKKAQEIQKKIEWKSSIGQILVRINAILEDELMDIISSKLSVNIINSLDNNIDPSLIKAFPADFVKKHMFFPISMDKKNLKVAMMDPANYSSLEMIAASTKKTVKADVVKESVLLEAFKTRYKISDREYEDLLTLNGFGAIPGVRDDVDAAPFDKDESLDFNKLISMATEEFETVSEDPVETQTYNSSDAAIIKLVNGILMEAISKGASDVHLEPFEKSLQVRFRVDGTLRREMTLPISIKSALASRLKIMSNLNIAEKRKPQDGRIKLKFAKNRSIDFRVSVLPTMFGEGVVLRVLDHTKLKMDLRKLGLAKPMMDQFLKMCERPQGLILVVGPTGSGKTNTLYSVINILNKPDMKILTVEDPVEFNFPGINQVSVNPVAGLTFASALRTFMRQDPEVILVGEIRDSETGEIALKAAMTGHLVFSTLHTNDGPSTVARLLNLGLPGYLISSSLTGILAQRLLKKICNNCKVEITDKIEKEYLIESGVDVDLVEDFKVYKGKGCNVCHGAGYSGRIAVFELLKVNEDLKEAMISQASEAEIRHIAMRDDYKTLRQDALEKANQGITSLDEAVKKTVLISDRLPFYLVDTHELIFEHGDYIAKEGSKETHFYQLLQGNLIVTKNDAILGEISKPNEFFCEMSPLFKQERSVSIKSNGRSVVRFFPGYKLKEVIEHSSEFGMVLLDKLSGKVKGA